MIKRLLISGADKLAKVVRPIATRVAREQAKDIQLQRQRRAVESTAEFVDRHLNQAKLFANKYDLLTHAFHLADVSGDRLICEFGVFEGTTINHLAQLTSKTIYGFDSFEGLPEAWSGSIPKGHFAMEALPKVKSNVKLVKGFFDKSLPGFLKENPGKAGLLHIDCDLYSSTKTVFELFESRLTPGTVIVFDEYFNYPAWEQGEHKAFNELISKIKGTIEFVGFVHKNEQVAVVLKSIGT